MCDFLLSDSNTFLQKGFFTMKKRNILLPMMALSLCFGLAACKPAEGQQSASQPGSQASVPAKETIKVTAAGDKKTIAIEETLQLTASVEGVTWASSDAKVATVDQTGKVTAVGAGEVAITASKEGYYKGSITLTVNRGQALATLHMEDADHYAADGWWGSAEDGYQPVYDRADSNASDAKCIAHFDAGDKETLTFNSSAAINAELVLTMASSSAIEDMSAVMSVKLNDAAITLAGGFEGGSSSEFGEYSLGTQNLKSGDNVLLIEFLAAGPYLDDLAFYSKQQATIQVKAAPAKEQIQLAATSIAAYIDTESQIQISKPTSLEGVSFVSDKADVASVNEQGKVTGHKLGTANITVKKDGWYSARLEVVVDKAGVEGEIRVQAEDAAEIPEGFHQYTDKTTGIQNGHYGGAYITGYDVNSACSLSYTFESTKDQYMELIVAGASHYQMAEDFVFGVDCTLKLNSKTITCKDGAKIESNQVMGAPTVEVSIGIVQVKQGTNTFVIEFAERAPALDAFRFIPASDN